MLSCVLFKVLKIEYTPFLKEKLLITELVSKSLDCWFLRSWKFSITNLDLLICKNDLSDKFLLKPILDIRVTNSPKNVTKDDTSTKMNHRINAWRLNIVISVLKIKIEINISLDYKGILGLIHAISYLSVLSVVVLELILLLTIRVYDVLLGHETNWSISHTSLLISRFSTFISLS